MIRNLLQSFVTHKQQDSAVGSSLPFPDYIRQCRLLIEERRCLHPSIQTDNADNHSMGIPIERMNPQIIIDANSPFETLAAGETKPRYGVVLIHGLLDSPFTMQDISRQLQQSGISSRAILLPGHGTTPADLLHVTYQDWLQTLQYAIATLRNEVDHVFLLGYSTGAALAVHQAIKDPSIRGVILLAPAIKIKSPLDILMTWQSALKARRKKDLWLCREAEIDYAKYHSVPFNAVDQVARLTKNLAALNRTHELNCPMYMIMSKEDETISSAQAVKFFQRQSNRKNHLCLYSDTQHHYHDARIEIRNSRYPSLNILNFSHVSLLFSPSNKHYGQFGDYIHASHIEAENRLYGAYNRIESSIYQYLYQRKIIKIKRSELTYNPDFDRMAADIISFIKSA